MRPVLQALVLAEHVYQDVTGKMIIAGTFNTVVFSRQKLSRCVKSEKGEQYLLVPGGMHSGSPYAYVSLTDVCDGTELKFQFVNLSKNYVILEKSIVLNPGNRLDTVEFSLPLPRLDIDEEGLYSFEVLCEGEILGAHRIKAREIGFTEDK